MASSPPRRRLSALAIAVGLLLFVGAGSVAVVTLRLGAAPAPADSPAAEPPPPPAGRDQAQEDAGRPAVAEPDAGARVAPSFDVVRVGPGGVAVFAGRAAPGDEVSIHDGSQLLGRVTADASGGWVLTPDRPLAPGGRELTLSARDPAASGDPERVGSAPVLLVVPDPGKGADGTGPLAVLAPDAAAPRVLQAPGAAAGPLGLDTVDYDESARIRFAGHAAPHATVRLYADNRPLGDATADASGRWALTALSLAPGPHQLRVDQVGERGAVVARVELPFRKVLLPHGAVRRGQVVVQPGENLWRLARTAYGDGLRYTVILRANRSQIRDPDRIYPGQAFTIPPLPQH